MQVHCKKCGSTLSVASDEFWLGENGSYFCDPATMKESHEPVAGAST